MFRPDPTAKTEARMPGPITSDHGFCTAQCPQTFALSSAPALQLAVRGKSSELPLNNPLHLFSTEHSRSRSLQRGMLRIFPALTSTLELFQKPCEKRAGIESCLSACRCYPFSSCLCSSSPALSSSAFCIDSRMLWCRPCCPPRSWTEQTCLGGLQSQGNKNYKSSTHETRDADFLAKHVPETKRVLHGLAPVSS